jgi:hypothetical protein
MPADCHNYETQHLDGREEKNGCCQTGRLCPLSLFAEPLSTKPAVKYHKNFTTEPLKQNSQAHYETYLSSAK